MFLCTWIQSIRIWPAASWLPLILSKTLSGFAVCACPPRRRLSMSMTWRMTTAKSRWDYVLLKQVPTEYRRTFSHVDFCVFWYSWFAQLHVAATARFQENITFLGRGAVWGWAGRLFRFFGKHLRKIADLFSCSAPTFFVFSCFPWSIESIGPTMYSNTGGRTLLRTRPWLLYAALGFVFAGPFSYFATLARGGGSSTSPNFTMLFWALNSWTVLRGFIYH